MRLRIPIYLWLAWVGPVLFAQSLSFPDGPAPFRINRVEIDAAGSVALRLWGERFDGSRVPLYTGPGIPAEQKNLCYVYLDDDIRLLEGEMETSAGNKVHLISELQRPPFRIYVYGFHGRLVGGSPWQEIYSAERLLPGDVYLLPTGGDPIPLIAAGIHVLTPDIQPMALKDTENPWRGYIVEVADLETNTLRAALDARKEELIAFKQRFRNLLLSLGFQGPRIPHQDPLSFPPATPAGIALTLQAETLPDRVQPIYRYALLIFSVAAILLLAAIRRWEILLPAIGLILTAFVIFSLLTPQQMQSLTVELALPSSQESSDAKPIYLQRSTDETARAIHYRQRDLPADILRLIYRSYLAPGARIPLRLFAGDEPVRFNQIPEVRNRDGRLLLGFRNPLSAWSLHEPQ